MEPLSTTYDIATSTAVKGTPISGGALLLFLLVAAMAAIFLGVMFWRRR
jgi:hypothetical protein